MCVLCELSLRLLSDRRPQKTTLTGGADLKASETSQAAWLPPSNPTSNAPLPQPTFGFDFRKPNILFQNEPIFFMKEERKSRDFDFIFLVSFI